MDARVQALQQKQADLLAKIAALEKAEQEEEAAAATEAAAEAPSAVAPAAMLASESRPRPRCCQPPSSFADSTQRLRPLATIPQTGLGESGIGETFMRAPQPPTMGGRSKSSRSVLQGMTWERRVELPRRQLAERPRRDNEWWRFLEECFHEKSAQRPQLTAVDPRTRVHTFPPQMPSWEEIALDLYKADIATSSLRASVSVPTIRLPRVDRGCATLQRAEAARDGTACGVHLPTLSRRASIGDSSGGRVRPDDGPELLQQSERTASSCDDYDGRAAAASRAVPTLYISRQFRGFLQEQRVPVDRMPSYLQGIRSPRSRSVKCPRSRSVKRGSCSSPRELGAWLLRAKVDTSDWGSTPLRVSNGT